MVRFHDKRVADAFADIEQEVRDTAGMIATSYAREGSREVAEEWVREIVRRLISSNGLAPLTKQTVDNRKSRGISVIGVDKQLFETGELFLNHLEARHTILPDKNYDIIEVGIFDDTTKIGHSDTITPYKLALINEYGRYDLGIPERPIFEESAMAMGYTSDRIFTNTWDRVKVAYDWSLGAKHRDPNSIAGAATGEAGYKSRSSNVKQTIIGKVVIGGSGVEIEWSD